MTREEAIKIMSKIWGGNPQHDLANSYVDAFVALDLLKLEEPVTVQHLAAERIAEYVGYEIQNSTHKWIGVYSLTIRGAEHLIKRLEAGGFRITQSPQVSGHE